MGYSSILYVGTGSRHERNLEMSTDSNDRSLNAFLPEAVQPVANRR